MNTVTLAVFAKYPTARSLAGAKPEQLEALIKPTGFFRNKTKSLIGVAKGVFESHAGEVPRTMDELVELPGVGRKTANVILGNAYATNEGVVVDTHVGRVSLRLGLVTETDPVKAEQQLMKLFQRENWARLSHLLLFHGRRSCEARVPKWKIGPRNDICQSGRV